MPNYPTLAAECARYGIKKKDLAEAIGATTRTVDRKLSKHSPFTLEDAAAIRNRFFPHMGVEQLFDMPAPPPTFIT